MGEIASLNDYQQQAARTAGNASLECAALGLCGESGEFADIIKKAVYHGHALDKEKAAKELGDTLWYIALAAGRLGYTLSEVASMNIEKLRIRYPDGFSTEASLARVDEAPAREGSNA